MRLAGHMVLMGLAYERFGAGPPLVLLHGIGHRRQAWDAVLDRLAPYRDLIVLDLPGHGESPPLQTVGRSVAHALVAETMGLLDELGLQRAHFAGSSLGGRLALEAAVAGRAASVTALSPAGFWRSSRELTYARAVSKAMQAAGRLIQPLGPALARTTAGRAMIYAEIVSKPSLVGSEQALGDMNAFLAARYTTNAILAAATPFAGSVPAGVPVTIAWGTNDRLLPPRQALVAKERIPQARLIPLPGCGHVPMTDNPRLVADVLLRGSRVAQHLGRQSAAGLGPTGRCPAVFDANRADRFFKHQSGELAERSPGMKFWLTAKRQRCSIAKAMLSGLVWINDLHDPPSRSGHRQVSRRAQRERHVARAFALRPRRPRYGDTRCDFW